MEKKVFIRRIISWGLIFLLCFSCFIIGILKYYNGYGKHGKIRYELMPIIEKFNSLDSIKNNNNSISASFANDNLEIKYVSKSVNLKYDFKLYENDEFKYIELEYNDVNEDIVEEFSKELIESISMINGNNYGEIFNKYEYTYFYTTNIEDGISIKKDSNKVTLLIVINKNILKTIDSKFSIIDKTSYITSLDLKDIYINLNKDNKFEYTKNDIYIYVEKSNNEYNIYISDKKNRKEFIKESILSCIYILDNGIYEKMINNKEDFSIAAEKDIYTIDKNPKLPENITIKNQSFIKVTIKR